MHARNSILRYLVPALSIGLLYLSTAGCSPSAEVKSQEDVTQGDEKLSEVDAMQRVEAVTDNDYSKMTQVDPNLKQEAMADYDKAIQEDPKNADAWYARGFAQLSHGDAMLKAVEDLTMAIDLKPDYAQAYLMRGRAYEALGDMVQAKADRAKALELQPGID
ncbi:MAG: tetratricopeptide repeat protein [Planctomycetales bacterium]|nr:tetratricopeptide repeat protein [Planctomycetales bacterium]